MIFIVMSVMMILMVMVMMMMMLIIILDCLHLSFDELAKIKRSLESYVDRMNTCDRMDIFKFDGWD